MFLVRAAMFSVGYPGLKPRAESLRPFGTEIAMLLPPQSSHEH
jgi:hypothetical protein